MCENHCMSYWNGQREPSDLGGRAVLVTGGAGFIGSHLVRRLLDLGAEVTVLDDFSTGHPENIADQLADITLVQADIRDDTAVRRAVHRREVVFHLAAVVSAAQSLADPLGAYEVTAGASVRVLRAAFQAGCRAVVLASSSAVYGDAHTPPLREDALPSPISPYGAAKLAAEGFGGAFARTYGLHVVPLRYFNVYGPRQDPRSQYAAVIPRFIAALLSGRPPVIYGDGAQTRDFIYVDDVVDATLRAAVRPATSGQVINVAGGKQHSIREVLCLLQKVSGVAMKPIYESPRPGDIGHSCADISRARELLGFAPSVGLEQGLTLTLDWFRGS